MKEGLINVKRERMVAIPNLQRAPMDIVRITLGSGDLGVCPEKSTHMDI